MAEIVNLRHARKQKARAQKEKRAAENRAAFGRGKDEKRAAADQRDRALAALEAHRREPRGDGAD